jgi:acyl-CoA reductase-like NAD-dependent aldehyde dehydrogenase
MKLIVHLVIRITLPLVLRHSFLLGVSPGRFFYTKFTIAKHNESLKILDLPLYLLTWKIAPCIAAGNTCVCKPSEITSMTAYMLCQVLNDAGVPKGVVNMGTHGIHSIVVYFKIKKTYSPNKLFAVFGNGLNAGAPLVQHPDVPLVSFTGGTVTGEKIYAMGSSQFKKLSLELGGKNPTIIFGDADIEKAVATNVRSAFANQGEICLCGSRIFVHESVFDEYVTKLVEKVGIVWL